jgi:hypothetical protein
VAAGHGEGSPGVGEADLCGDGIVIATGAPARPVAAGAREWISGLDDEARDGAVDGEVAVEARLRVVDEVLDMARCGLWQELDGDIVFRALDAELEGSDLEGLLGKADERVLGQGVLGLGWGQGEEEGGQQEGGASERGVGAHGVRWRWSLECEPIRGEGQGLNEMRGWVLRAWVGSGKDGGVGCPLLELPGSWVTAQGEGGIGLTGWLDRYWRGRDYGWGGSLPVARGGDEGKAERWTDGDYCWLVRGWG